MGYSSGVLKGSCGAYGEEGRGLEEELRSPLASSWILTPITSAETEKDAKTGGGEAGLWAVVGKDIDFEAALVWHAQQKHDPQIIKYHLLLWSSQCIITFNVYCTNDSLKA